ncbi:MAG: Multiple sugar transport system substrate-binding protein [Labilithrix sp.]|nr:Multiple sugar transport system substrate-binding protein [Labilithrix sp.]
MSHRLLVLVLVLVSLSCTRHDASTAPPPDARTTITFVGWGAPEERQVLEEVITAFEQAHPQVRVIYTQVPGVGYDYLNKLRLMLVAGIAPDVFYVPDGAFGELVRTGALLDLESLVARSRAVDAKAIWPTALERYRWNGHRLHEGDLYALPKDLGPTAMFYDADRLRARGVAPPDPHVPMTWSEAVAMWHVLTFDDGGVHRYGITSFPYEDAVWSSGEEVLSPDRRSWNLTSPIAVRAVQWCADLALREHVAPNPTRLGDSGGGGRELFEARLAAMHIDGRWMVPRFRQLEFAWDVAPIPVPERGAPSITWSGSVGLAISAKSKKTSEAFALVEYLAGPEGQARLTATGLQLPNQRELAATDLFLQPGLLPRHAEVFVLAAENSRPAPATLVPNAFWYDVFTSFAEEVWRGDRTAASLFPEIKPRIDQAIRRRNPEL